MGTPTRRHAAPIRTLSPGRASVPDQPALGRNPAELAALWGAYALMVAATAGAEALRLNGTTASELAHEAFGWAVPAVFSLVTWGCAYGGLAWWLVAATKARTAQTTRTFRWSSQGKLFIACCALNAAWVVAWHFRQAVLAALAATALLACAALLYSSTRARDKRVGSWASASLYLAWVAVACTACVARLAERLAGPVSPAAAALACIALAAALLSAAFALEHYLGDPYFGLMVAWAVAGVGTGLLEVAQPVGAALLAMTALGCLLLFRNRSDLLDPAWA